MSTRMNPSPAKATYATALLVTLVHLPSSSHVHSPQAALLASIPTKLGQGRHPHDNATPPARVRAYLGSPGTQSWLSCTQTIPDSALPTSRLTPSSPTVPTSREKWAGHTLLWPGDIVGAQILRDTRQCFSMTAQTPDRGG